MVDIAKQPVTVSQRDRLFAGALLLFVAGGGYAWTRFDLAIAAARGSEGTLDPTMTGLHLVAPFLLLLIVPVLHEFVHAVAARVLGQSPATISYSFEGINPSVSVGEGLTRLRFQAVLLAPLLLALLPLPLLDGKWSVYAYCWYLVATLGGVNDVATAWACRGVASNWKREAGGDGRNHVFIK